MIGVNLPENAPSRSRPASGHAARCQNMDARPIPAYFFRRAAALHRADGRRGPVVLLDLDPAAVRRIGRTQFAFQALRLCAPASTQKQPQSGSRAIQNFRFIIRTPPSFRTNRCRTASERQPICRPLNFVFFRVMQAFSRLRPTRSFLGHPKKGTAHLKRPAILLQNVFPPECGPSLPPTDGATGLSRRPKPSAG